MDQILSEGDTDHRGIPDVRDCGWGVEKSFLSILGEAAIHPYVDVEAEYSRWRECRVQRQ